jgi:hypothetical protein
MPQFAAISGNFNSGLFLEAGHCGQGRITHRRFGFMVKITQADFFNLAKRSQ